MDPAKLQQDLDHSEHVQQLLYEGTVNSIERCFTYHPPKPGQPEIYESLRNQAKELALFMARSQPMSLELRAALAALQEAVMWCNAGIARNT